MAIQLNPAGLTDAKVRTALGQMSEAINVKAQAMTTKANRKKVQCENPPAYNLVKRLRCFTRMNPPFFIGFKISKDIQEFVEEFQNISVAIGAINIEKAELASYQPKYVSQTWCKMWQDSRALAKVRSLKNCLRHPFLRGSSPGR